MQKEQLYRVYTTEMLSGIARSLGYEVPYSYYELSSAKKTKEVGEPKSAEVVIGNIREKLSRLGGEE